MNKSKTQRVLTEHYIRTHWNDALLLDDLSIDNNKVLELYKIHNKNVGEEDTICILGDEDGILLEESLCEFLRYTHISIISISPENIVLSQFGKLYIIDVFITESCKHHAIYLDFRTIRVKEHDDIQ